MGTLLFLSTAIAAIALAFVAEVKSRHNDVLRNRVDDLLNANNRGVEERRKAVEALSKARDRLDENDAGAAYHVLKNYFWEEYGE